MGRVGDLLANMMGGYDISDEEYDRLMQIEQEKAARKIAERYRQKQWEEDQHAQMRKQWEEAWYIEIYGKVLPEYYEGIVCRIIKPMEEFCKISRSSDGRNYICLVCDRAKYKKRRREKHAQELERERAKYWRDPQKNIAQAVARARKGKQRSEEANFKFSVRQSLRLAVSQGRVVKPGYCEDCLTILPTARIHGHHQDYSKPLDVRWLCSKCHGLAHRIEAQSPPANATVRNADVRH